jgi:signal transduction histidine kinase
MNQLLSFLWKGFCVSFLFLLPFSGLDLAIAAKTEVSNRDFAVVTSLYDLRKAVSREPGRVCAFDLSGTILAADRNSGTLFLQDASGTEVLETGLRGAVVTPGQQIRLQGTNYVACTHLGLSLGKKPVVDADGMHTSSESSGTVYLKAGRHPIRVVWYNEQLPEFLKVEYSGPDLVRQTIPDSALFRLDRATGDGATQLVNGLTYRCFEGLWRMLPDFSALIPTKTGIVSNFELSVSTRQEDVGVEFEGFMNVADNGDYSFYLTSDDGSQLFLDCLPPNLTVIGTAPVPSPRRISISQPLPREKSCFWAEAEGVVSFLSKRGEGAELELTADNAKMRVKVLNAEGGNPSYLLHSHVRVRGICLNTTDLEENKHAGLMVTPYWRGVRVDTVSPEQWSAFQSSSVGELGTNSGIVHILGRLSVNSGTQQVNIEDATGSVPIELLSELPVNLNAQVDCLGRWTWDRTNALLHQAISRKYSDNRDSQTNALPLLTTAIQVQQLKPEEADRKYPVTLRGVATQVSEDFGSLTIQDSTRGVFIKSEELLVATRPSAGDYCQIEGSTRAGDFSPLVISRKLTILSHGDMPQPEIPTRAQLLSGSLDAQYVEIRGLVVSIHGEDMTLLGSDGMLDLNIRPAPDLRGEFILNSVIRVRCSLIANWDQNHRAIQPIRIRNAAIAVDAPPPINPFDAERLHARDLMKYDVRFDTFRRIKVSGQILSHSANMYYMLEDVTGLRFRPAEPVRIEPGDTAEVVGLLEWGGASPLLRQAVVRKTGHSPLPQPRPLLIDSLDDSYDSTRVRVDGVLVGINRHGAELVFELQVGARVLTARLPSKDLSEPPWAVGSRLRLTGVFCSLDRNQGDGRKVNSFELLLNSTDDVLVVSRPSWWTLGRLVVIMAMLLVGLSLAFVWITLLRRQVERRTIQLKREMRERERAEQGRIIELERSRIARDLHDDLGSQLTGLSMLASANPGLKMTYEQTRERMLEIADKSRSMTIALDRLVWLINSKNDTLSALVEYLASYVEEFLSKAGIAVRIELPASYPERTIVAEVRNHVLLSVREALNNAVRHGQPTEVLLRLVLLEDEIEILIQDNGCGFEAARGSLGNGLVNLHERMSQLSGRCQITSFPGKGTSVLLKLPLSLLHNETPPQSPKWPVSESSGLSVLGGHASGLRG